MSFSVSVAAELQFVQIILIMVVMAVMVVLIICLLNHYKFSGCSGMTRQSQGSRQEEMLQQVGLGCMSGQTSLGQIACCPFLTVLSPSSQGPSAWPQDSTAPTQGASEVSQVITFQPNSPFLTPLTCSSTPDSCQIQAPPPNFC